MFLTMFKKCTIKEISIYLKIILIVHTELVIPMWINSKTVRFTSFRKHTLVYRWKKSIKDFRLKVDLTKKRHTFLIKATEYVKNIPKVKF